MLNQYKFFISKYLEGKKDIYLYFKGRVALYAILKSMGIKEGDELILPAYTCVVVPNALKYIGAKPIYVDVDPETYNINYKLIENKITEKTKAIIIQNTYGLSSNVEEIIKIAKKHNLYTVEDCCHGFGGTYNEKPNGTLADASFFSTQWNKPFSTGVGGFALINNESLKIKMDKFSKSLLEATRFDKAWLTVLYQIKKYLVNKNTYWFMLKFYRFLSKHNVVLGSSSGGEINSNIMPKNYLKKVSIVQIKEGIKSLRNLDQILILRKKNALIYSDYLRKNSKKHVADIDFANHSFLKYPILVNDRAQFFKLAEKAKISLGDWFISPLHPIKKDFCLWDFNKKDYPIATDIASKVVNLPTETKEIDKVIIFMEKHKEYII